jgi:hypothetical protein
VQIRTYSIALALAGRSAACAPPTVIKTATEPRMKFLTAIVRPPQYMQMHAMYANQRNISARK